MRQSTNLSSFAVLAFVALTTAQDALKCPDSNGTTYTGTSGSKYVIECGIDHQGGDLENGAVGVKPGDLAGCIDACDKNSDCVDVSLLGTGCYLKGNLGNAVPQKDVWGARRVLPEGATTTTEAAAGPTGPSCPGSNSTIYTGSSGSNFTIECGIDHAGGDLQNGSIAVNIGDFKACIDACDKNLECVDVSMLGTGCYLKGTLGHAAPQKDVWGARRLGVTPTATIARPPAATKTPGPSCPDSDKTVYTGASGDEYVIECDTDHAGGDLSSTSVEPGDLEACIEACDEVSNCVDVSLSGVACYLKEELGVAMPAKNVWGARRLAAAGPTSTGAAPTATAISCPNANGTTFTAYSYARFEIGCDVESAGGDIGEVSYVSNLEGCVQKCDATDGCVAAALSGNSIGETSASPGVSYARLTVPRPECPSPANTTYTASNGKEFAIECDIDREGGGYDSVNIDSPRGNGDGWFGGCIEKCAANDTCVDISLQGAGCYLKETLRPAVSAKGIFGARWIDAPTKPVAPEEPEPTSTAVSPPEVGKFEFLACYNDTVAKRTLKGPFLYGTKNETMTVEKCAEYCENAGYFGLEYGQECYCGNAILNNATTTPGKCTIPCTGDSSQLCGGLNALSLYRALDFDDSLPPEENATTSSLSTSISSTSTLSTTAQSTSTRSSSSSSSSPVPSSSSRSSSSSLSTPLASTQSSSSSSSSSISSTQSSSSSSSNLISSSSSSSSTLSTSTVPTSSRTSQTSGQSSTSLSSSSTSSQSSNSLPEISTSSSSTSEPASTQSTSSSSSTLEPITTLSTSSSLSVFSDSSSSTPLPETSSSSSSSSLSTDTMSSTSSLTSLEPTITPSTSSSSSILSSSSSFLPETSSSSSSSSFSAETLSTSSASTTSEPTDTLSSSTSSSSLPETSSSSSSSSSSTALESTDTLTISSSSSSPVLETSSTSPSSSASSTSTEISTSSPTSILAEQTAISMSSVSTSTVEFVSTSSSSSTNLEPEITTLSSSSPDSSSSLSSSLDSVSSTSTEISTASSEETSTATVVSTETLSSSSSSTIQSTETSSDSTDSSTANVITVTPVPIDSVSTSSSIQTSSTNSLTETESTDTATTVLESPSVTTSSTETLTTNESSSSSSTSTISTTEASTTATVSTTEAVTVTEEATSTSTAPLVKRFYTKYVAPLGTILPLPTATATPYNATAFNATASNSTAFNSTLSSNSTKSPTGYRHVRRQPNRAPVNVDLPYNP